MPDTLYFLHEPGVRPPRITHEPSVAQSHSLDGGIVTAITRRA